MKDNQPEQTNSTKEAKKSEKVTISTLAHPVTRLKKYKHDGP